MKKIIVSSVVAFAVLLAGAATANAAFTRNLTVGSTGSDVAELQSWLISKGFSIPSISSGAAAPGYFGQQTKDAVTAYQASVGLPNTGFFGPLTMAKVAGGAVGTTPPPAGALVIPFPCPAGYTAPAPWVCPNAGSNNPGGEEGQLTDFDTLGDVESDVDEGDEEVNVLGVEFEAEDSDMTIDRVDVDFELTSGTASDKLDDYVTEVSLWLDGKKLGSMDVDDADEDNDIFSFRFSGLGAKVNDGSVAELYVAVNAVNNIDSDDTDGVWTVSVPANGIRASDTAGISETYRATALSETFSVGGSDVGDLDVTEASASPDAGIVTVDDENDTNDVTILVIDLEADNQDIIVDEVPVGFVGSGAEVDEIVKTVKLVMGSTVLDSKTVSASAGNSYQVVFDNLDLEIAEGDTESLKVVIDVNDFEGNFAAGDSIYATTTGSDAGWDVEDSNGENVTPDGSITGSTQSFYQDGIQVTYVGKSNGAAYSSTESSGIKNKVDYSITFDVKAVGSHAILDRTATRAQVTDPTASTDGISWSTTTASTVGTTTVSAIFNSDESADEDDEHNFWIQEGDTRRFTLDVTLENQSSANGSAAIRLRGINWAATTTANITADATAADQLYNFDLNKFVTSASNIFDN